MQISIGTLKEHCTKLNEIIDEYLDVFNNYYNEVNFIPNYWNSPKANYFFYITESEKKENLNFYSELISLSELYNFIIEKYSGIQEKLFVNNDGKDIVTDKFIQNNIEQIVDEYNGIYSDQPTINEKLTLQQQKLKDNKEKLLNYKDEVKNIFINTDNVEKEIKYKINEITVKKISRASSEVKSLGDVDDIYFDIQRLTEISDKMKNRYNNFESNYSELEKILSDILDDYDSSNSSTLEELHNTILAKYEMVKNNIFNNLIILNDNIENMKYASRLTNEMDFDKGE